MGVINDSCHKINWQALISFGQNQPFYKCPHEYKSKKNK